VGQRQEGWASTARVLVQQGRISEALALRIGWQELFGHLTGNTDMHFGNLSFLSQGERLLDLTPAYDMLPMGYAPHHGTLVSAGLQLPTPSPSHAQVWRGALEAARALWSSVSEDPRVSESFRAIAGSNLTQLDGWAEVARRLPN
jgi:HipA-like C-terminal domain